MRYWLVLLSSILMTIVLRPVQAAQVDADYRIVGYYTYYSIYDDYFVTDIPAGQLTHLNYAFIDISDVGQCVSADEWADMQFPYPGDKENERLRGNFKQLALLKQAYPDLKILMTVGGWEFSDKFTDVASTRNSRVRFANSCIAFMRQYGFDGIDIDWRYPVAGGIAEGKTEDSENFTLLLSELDGQLDYWRERDGEPYALTVTAPAIELLYQYFPLLQLEQYVDWFNVMTFSFQGEWSEIASPHAPLYANVRDPRGEVVQEQYNVEGAVDAFLTAGIPANKIVIGLPFFGQAWRGVSPNDRFGLYQETDGVPSGTRPGGLLYYRDLTPLLSNSAYVRFFDEETKSPWLYNQTERIAISYDDEESISYKAAFVRGMGLGGVMLWELGFDDETHTLLNAVAEAFQASP